MSQESASPDRQPAVVITTLLKVLDVRPAVDCARCGAETSTNYGSRRSCRRCGATWQAP
jgi:hypothetical protein